MSTRGPGFMPHMLVPGWAGVGGASPQPPTPRPCPHSKKRPPSDLSLQGQDFRVRRSLAGPQKMKYSDHESVSCSVVSDSFATPQTEAHQAPRSVGFFRQEYWSGLPFPSPGDLPGSFLGLSDPEIEPGSPVLQADSSSSEPLILRVIV